MSAAAESAGRIVALCGGVGGAKLAFGLEGLFGDRLTLVVNTGDDFEHLGLSISPDIDTVLYTLSDEADRERGWGRRDEGWRFMESLVALGGPDWFNLGDRDLAIHILRTEALRQGASLTEVVARFSRRLGLKARILPMSDDPVRTLIDTTEGLLAFQEYFVARRAEPTVRRIRFKGAEAAAPNPAALDALHDPALSAVILCPSNPYLSIDPILAMPAMRRALETCAAPIVVVSPIIGGQAVKGPTRKIMDELGVPATSHAIARHYEGLADGLVLDQSDQGDAEGLGLPCKVARTLMETDDDRRSLAASAVDFAEALSPAKRLGAA